MIKESEIFIVIPAYNEEKLIGKVIDEVKKYLKRIIVVDDGSTDKTAKNAQKKNVIVLKHLVNLGKGVALKTGFEVGFSQGGKVGIMFDADGQHQSEDLLKFIKEIKKGEEVVLGYRSFSDKEPWLRRTINNFGAKLVFTLFGLKVKDLTCGLRSLSKRAYNKIKWESSSYEVETEMVVKIARLGLRHKEVPIETVYLDKYKGVTIVDAISVLLNVLKWRFSL